MKSRRVVCLIPVLLSPVLVLNPAALGRGQDTFIDFELLPNGEPVPHGIVLTDQWACEGALLSGR